MSCQLTEYFSLAAALRPLPVRSNQRVPQLRGDVPLHVGPAVSYLPEEAAAAEAEPRLLELKAGADAQ